MWVGFASIKTSILGAKAVGNPETPGVSPDTPEIPHPETLGINPDTPEISGYSGLKSGYSGFRRVMNVGLFGQQYL